MSLFDFSQQSCSSRPLADRLRPNSLENFFGQEHIVGKGKLLRRAIETDTLTSSIFYGPPGCGKTTLANIIAKLTKSNYYQLNAVTAGVSELKEILKTTEEELKLFGKRSYLLLDECHRWSKAQSDCILPAIESGLIRFIGSTTENPMITLTPALVSRCRIFQFTPLTPSDIRSILYNALSDKENGLGKLSIDIDKEALEHLISSSNGDVRMALNALELAALSTAPLSEGLIKITLQVAEDSIQKPVLRCDESLYYDMLSAFCKSMRGSDSDAALLWFSRLLYAGVDPKLIARRIIAHASEDVGLAEPNAMLQAVAAAQSLQLVGMPEARLSLSQAIIFICESPKSNSIYNAMSLAQSDAESGNFSAVPPHLRDTHYKGHDKINGSNKYLYPHDYEDHYVKQNYMPEGYDHKIYYIPGRLGYEHSLKRKKQE